MSPAIDPEFVKILCCPETRQALSLADAALVDRLNRQIAAGALFNRAGRPLKERLDAGLVRTDGLVLYPIFRGLPVMLVDEAISLRAEDGPRSS